MKTQRYLFLLSIICLSVLLVQCKKGDDGPIGPAGEKGDAGANGAAGAKGATGAAGATGTANVIYSDWITPVTYTKTTVFGTTIFSYNIAASKVTQAILDKGTIIVYGKLNGYNPVIWPADQVSVLPIAITYMSGAAANIDTWSAVSSVGKIQISLTSSLNAYSSISNAHSFRYIIIPGGVRTAATVNLKNYAQVKQAFHLTD